MDKDQTEEDDYEYEINVSRASTIGHQTSDHNRTQHIIHEIVDYHNLDLKSFVEIYEKHPNIKDQTKLIEKIFANKHFTEDLIRFLMSPEKMISKYSLAEIEAHRFVNTIQKFLNQNYQFYEHYFISVEESLLDYQIWFQFLQNQVSEIYVTSLGYLLDIFLPFIKYEYSTSSRVTQHFEMKYNNYKGIPMINSFSEGLIAKMLKYTQWEAIVKILFYTVLVSLQEEEWNKTLMVLKQLCLSSIKDESLQDSHIENVYWMIKEVSNNIQKDIHNTIFAFTNAFAEANLVKASINRVTAFFSSSNSPKLANGPENNEELALQYNLKFLAEMVNIYYLLRKINIDYNAAQVLKLKNNIMQIYQNLNAIMTLVLNSQAKTLKFSNGENIKANLLYRFQLLNLIKLSATVIKQYGESCPQLQNKLDKSIILELLIRCLSENRWNNILQCTIEKILCLIITPELFKATNNCAQRFLKFIVETFSNKKYMFLNSAKMINQGDINFLYFISRKITIQLDRTPGIIDSTNQYDFWKQFVLNVLQKYENNNERLSKISDWDDINDKADKDGDFKVEIDEFTLIKEIVKKIEVNQKWNYRKQNHEYGIVRGGSASNLNMKIPHQKSEKSGSPTTHKTIIMNIKKSKSILSEERKTAELEKNLIKAEEIDLLRETSSHSDSEVGNDEDPLKDRELKH